MPKISFLDVRSTWSHIAAMELAAREALSDRFLAEQPIITVYIAAVTEDLGDEAAELAVHVALATDQLYERALGRKPHRVEEGHMERADAVIEQNAADLVGVEPEAAMRQMMAQREYTVPEIPEGLITLMIEDDDDPDSEAGMAGFLVAKAVALAYEYANDLQEMPAAPPERPEHWVEHDDESNLDDETTTALIALMDKLISFLNDLSNDAEVAEHALAWEDTQEDMIADGASSGVSILLAMYFLFDLPLSGSGKTLGERYLCEHGVQLGDEDRRLLGELNASHLGIYDALERSLDGQQNRFRDLASGQVVSVTDAIPEHLGDVVIVRLIGPPEEAHMAGSPLRMLPESRDTMVDLLEYLRKDFGSPADPDVETQATFMKRTSLTLIQFLVSSGALDEEGDEEDDGGDDDEDAWEDELEDDEDEPDPH